MKGRFLYRAWRARLRDQRLEIRITRALVREGDLVADVGANKGAYVHWLRMAVGESGTVLAFEPQPTLAAYLRTVCDAFRWSNVRVSEIALSNKPGSAVLHVPGGGAAPGASLEASALDAQPGTRLTCDVDTLDRRLDGTRPLRFLKVDVEGHELAVFQGAVGTLARDKPYLLFECEARHLRAHTMADVFAFLASLGFRGFLLLNSALVPVARFDPAVHQPRVGADFWKRADYHNNFLFVHADTPLGPVADVIEA